MSRSERIKELIPFYAAGTLAPEERAEVEAFIAGNPEAQRWLDAANELAAADHPEFWDLESQIPSPQHLVDYQQGELDPETSQWVESKLHLESVREALNHLKLSDAAIESQETQPDESSAQHKQRESNFPLWDKLRATLLHPAPALAYLLILLVVPVLWQLDRVRTGAPLSAPVRQSLESIGTTRGDAPPAAELPGFSRQETGKAQLWLELRTDFGPSDLERVALVAELWSQEQPIFRLSEPLAAPRQSGDDWVFDVLIDMRRLPIDRTYEVRLTAVAPGDPVDGQPLYRHAFRWEP